MVKREDWTGALVGRMHIYGITATELAEEMCCSKAYVGMLLNGQRTPKGGRERLETALERLVSQREEARRV